MSAKRSYGVPLVSALAVLCFVLVWPVGWTGSSPLPWDESGHYLGAVDVREAIVHQDAGALGRAVFGADQYPPGHSIVLGIWMVLFGTGVASWLSFGLLVHALTAALLARLHVAAGLLFVGLGMFGGLAPSLMVEPLAVLWVVLALSLQPERIATRREALCSGLAWFAAGLALMTKYNFGLPLVGAMGLAALVRGDRASILKSSVAAGVVLLVWAAFLSVQDQGWEMFRSFARNRANSIGASPLDRVTWYAESFRQWWIGSTPLLIGLAATLLVAVARAVPRWRDPRFVAPTLVTCATLIAFALHPYLLGRNLVILVAAALVLIGRGMGSLEWSTRTRPIHVAVTLLALLIIPLSGGLRARIAQTYYPASARALEPVSDLVGREIEGGGKVRVVGTFNELGPGWIQLLRARQAPSTGVVVDAAYPLSRDRDRLDPAWDDRYLDIVRSWASDGTRRIVAMELTPGSPFRTEDYARWGQWKANLSRALGECGDFALVERDSVPKAGVVVSVFAPAVGSE